MTRRLATAACSGVADSMGVGKVLYKLFTVRRRGAQFIPLRVHARYGHCTAGAHAWLEFSRFQTHAPSREADTDVVYALRP